MKHILITGADSFIGASLAAHLQKQSYKVTELDLLDKEWVNFSFSPYDVVLHVAAIVHQKEQPEMESLYFRVNRDLAAEVARKAKAKVSVSSSS